MIHKSIKKNYIYNLMYQILILITPLITTPYLSRVLGADGIGTYSYIDSVSSYFVLFATLGLTTLGQRETSYVQDNREKRTIIFWEIFIIELIACLLCTIAYIIFSLKQGSNANLYLVLVFNMLAVLVNISWLYQGMEEFGQIVFKNTVFKIIGIVYVFVFVKLKDDLILYLFGISFFLFLGNLSLWLNLPRYVDRPSFRYLHPSKHLKAVISLFIPTIAIQIYTVLDKTMIGLITNSSFENGYYEQAIKIYRMVLTLVTSLGIVMIPRVGFFYNKGDTEAVQKYMYRGYQFVWFLGIPLSFGLLAISSNFVPWFFGDGYAKVASLISIFSFLILVVGISNVTGVQYLIPTKRQHIFSFTVIVGALINLILNLFLIRILQSYGAAIASVIAETVITATQLYIVRKELSPLVIIKSGYHYFIAGGIMLFALLAIRSILTPSILHTLILIFSGAGVYFLILFVMKDEFFISNLRNILIKFINRR
ncbi:flippase [Erysipelotrichaceae bacterium AF15-26LB]|nr:flippase [Erysipelotrichaceae bacterium AF19-24AC]RJV90607.1 flippase [Erysipelotrichaceae bacterium AF15-26LB]